MGRICYDANGMVLLTSKSGNFNIDSRVRFKWFSHTAGELKNT